MSKINIDQIHADSLVGLMVDQMVKDFGPRKCIRVYPVPRGGVPVAYMLREAYPAQVHITQDLLNCDAIVDDIIDSGATKKHYAERYNLPFYALITKTKADKNWYVFPWERVPGKDHTIEENITRLLQYVGEDPKRGGLVETPSRVVKAWDEWCSGYQIKPEDIFKTFEDGSQHYNEMIIVKGLPFYSHCEHHLAPFFGEVSIGYIPDGKILGLSKFGRLVDCFAKRLQVQERLTTQIGTSIEEHLNPIGVAVQVKARHLCMESRGLSKQGHHTQTTYLGGAMRDHATRMEFLEGLR